MGYILDKYGRNNIEKTNEIWFLLYEVPAKTYKKWNQKSQLEIDDDKIVLVYKDIENSSKTIFINKDEQEEFEMTHTIIEGNLKINDPIDRYYNARHEFFNLCINEGQEVAVQRTLLKYSEK